MIVTSCRDKAISGNPLQHEVVVVPPQAPITCLEIFNGGN